jgi:hypothetical protein
VRAQLLLQRVQLFASGQVAVEQQVDDFLEGRVRRKIVDVVSAIGEAALLTLDITKQRAPDDDAFEPAIDNDSGGRQCRIPPGRVLIAARRNPWTSH